MTTLQIINLAIMLAFFLCYSYQFFYIPVAWFKKDAPHREPSPHRIAVLIAARNEQSMNETRIQTLQEMLEHAEVGETPADDGVVEPGMVVTATVAGREQTFLLGSRDAGGDLGVQVFSTQAPLGAAVIGHRPGDKLSYEAPNGRVIEVEIIEAKPFVG